MLVALAAATGAAGMSEVFGAALIAADRKGAARFNNLNFVQEAVGRAYKARPDMAASEATLPVEGLFWAAGATCPPVLATAARSMRYEHSRFGARDKAAARHKRREVARWAWVPAGYAPCANPSGAFVLELTAGTTSSDTVTVAFAVGRMAGGPVPGVDEHVRVVVDALRVVGIDRRRGGLLAADD